MTPEDYFHQVREFIGLLGDVLSDSEVSEIMHLVDHGEPAEGLRTLAWIIHDENKEVSKEILDKLLSLMGGLISDEHLPPGFRSSTQLH